MRDRLARAALLWALAGCGCGGSISQAEHRAELASQQAEYEARLREIEAVRQRREAEWAREAEDGAKDRDAIARRLERLETALAEKQRLLDHRAGAGAAAGAPAAEDRGGRAGAERIARLKAELERALQATPAAVRELRVRTRSITLTLALDALVAPGATRLSAGGQPLAEALGEAISGAPGLRARIEVHADAVPPSSGGTVGDTWALTQRQGLALARALLAKGLDPSQLELVARGHYAPAASNDTEEGRALNRRIVLWLAAPSAP
ncbi:MAG: OmpA family protein [Deltaproteobacteria bacterium]|nr:OmpA family protein [Deltaproteobacteria bacterium]